MIKAVIFDYYGVLTTDQYLSWLHRHPEVVSHNQGAIESLSKAQDLGLNTDEFFARLAAIAKLPVQEVRGEFGIHKVTDRGLVHYIGQLRNLGLKTAILSNAPLSLYDSIAQLGLGHLFDAVLCSEEAGVVKPDPAIFTMILKRLGLSPDQAIFTDDRDYNVQGAEAVGMKGILYTDLANLRLELAKLNIVASD